MIDYTFGEWLKNQLQERRWSAAKLARRSQLATITTILEGRREPSFIVRERLAQGLGLPAAEVHECYAQTQSVAQMRARAANIKQVIEYCRALLSLETHSSRSVWQGQWLLQQFQTLPVDARAEVLAAIADSPALHEPWLAQIKALLPGGAPCLAPQS